MNLSGDELTTELLDRARSGDGVALGQLLERYRNYVSLLLRIHVGRRLQVKVDIDDLVQETWLQAHRNIGRFRGRSELELLVWLRALLGTTLANQIRHYYGTKRRDLRMERDWVEEFERSSHDLDRNLVASISSPSQQAARREQAVLLADALGDLPEDYREVIILRQLEDLSFPEVALRMGRSEHSVKNLWVRALARLRNALEDLR
jgi:RNA polymerase sigma-70 factor, ECF subfamily